MALFLYTQNPPRDFDSILVRRQELSEGTRNKRRARFNSVDDVVAEMKVIYRQSRRGEIGIDEGRKLFQMLEHIRAGLEVVELERRLEAVEMYLSQTSDARD